LIFFVLDQLRSDPFYALITLLTFVLGIVLALSFHEFSHALSAHFLGDNTARSQGRLTLNPAAHIDPLGGIMLLVVGLGWAKPTPVDPSSLRGDPRSGMAIVALAGPVSNVVIATIAAIPVRAGLIDSAAVGFRRFSGGDVVEYVVASFVFWNLLIAAFNLLPVAPLDGFKVALGILPRDAAVSFARLERSGPKILIILIMSGFLLGFSPIFTLWVQPIVNLLALLVLGSTLW
jgi:Zn-dependent protease